MESRLGISLKPFCLTSFGNLFDVLLYSKRFKLGNIYFVLIESRRIILIPLWKLCIYFVFKLPHIRWVSTNKTSSSRRKWDRNHQIILFAFKGARAIPFDILKRNKCKEKLKYPWENSKHELATFNFKMLLNINF